jgi:THO complex subunit 3
MRQAWQGGRETKEYHGHKKKVHSLAWNCVGEKLASGSVDQSVRIWAIDQAGRSTGTELKGHQDSVDQLRWDPKQPEVHAQHICSAVRYGCCAHRCLGLHPATRQCAYGTRALGSARMRSVGRRSPSGSTRRKNVQSRTSSAPCIAETKGENINIRWSPDGQHIAVGDKDDNISLIETRKSKPLKNIKFAFEVNEMAWDPSGKLFFLTTGGGTVEVFRYLDMLKPGGAGPGFAAAPHPSFTFASAVHASIPGEVGSARTLHAHTANCYCIEFAPNGEYFAVGSADALVSLWHLQELVCMRTFERLEWPVRTLSFSHDSAFIASGELAPPS